MTSSNTVDTYQLIIIIGSARSGTNMLRDLLTQLPGFGTWPCDEINYIWRHGNRGKSSDEFGPELATTSVQTFIRRAFDKQVRKQSLSYIVEKTCANSLRVGFVNRIFPEAQFIHIIRDGRDVVASAQKRWTAPLDLPYIARKARYVPITDLPYYASRYLASRLYRVISHERRLSTWGPRFAGIDDALQRHSLAEMCALQWQRSVEKSQQAFSDIEPARIYRVKYEELVTTPELELQRLGTFLGINIAPEQAKTLTRDVSTKSIGRWKAELDQNTLESVEFLLQKTLESYDYQLLSR